MPEYYCGVCGAAATVDKNGLIARTCEHVDSRVVAPRSAILLGEGSANQKFNLSAFTETLLRKLRGI